MKPRNWGFECWRSLEDEYAKKFAEGGIEFIPVFFKRRDFSPWGKWKTVRALKDIYERESIDLMHLFTLEAILAGSLAAGKNGPKVVHSVAGMGFAYSGQQLSRRVLRAGLNPFMKRCLPKGPVIVENDGDRHRVLEIMGPRAKFPVVRLPGGGIDIEKFTPDGPVALKRESDKVRFLLAGRLLRDKGAGLFAEAVKQYAGPEAEFLVAGMPDEGNPDSFTREEVEEWTNIPGFRWLGNVDDMPSLLRSVDVLVHPTFYGEGLPRIIMEAAASGLSVITTNIPACAETIKHGTNGWILDRKDPTQLATMMADAASHPEIWEEMKIRNRKQAETEFDQRRVIRATQNVYRNHFPEWHPVTELSQ